MSCPPSVIERHEYMCIAYRGDKCVIRLIVVLEQPSSTCNVELRIITPSNVLIYREHKDVSQDNVFDVSVEVQALNACYRYEVVCIDTNTVICDGCLYAGRIMTDISYVTLEDIMRDTMLMLMLVFMSRFILREEKEEKRLVQQKSA